MPTFRAWYQDEQEWIDSLQNGCFLSMRSLSNLAHQQLLHRLEWHRFVAPESLFQLNVYKLITKSIEFGQKVARSVALTSSLANTKMLLSCPCANGWLITTSFWKPLTNLVGLSPIIFNSTDTFNEELREFHIVGWRFSLWNCIASAALNITQRWYRPGNASSVAGSFQSFTKCLSVLFLQSNHFIIIINQHSYFTFDVIALTFSIYFVVSNRLW